MKFLKSFCTEGCCSIYRNKIITWKTWDFSREEVFTFLFLLRTGLVRDPWVMVLTKWWHFSSIEKFSEEPWRRHWSKLLVDFIAEEMKTVFLLLYSQNAIFYSLWLNTHTHTLFSVKITMFSLEFYLASDDMSSTTRLLTGFLLVPLRAGLCWLHDSWSNHGHQRTQILLWEDVPAVFHVFGIVLQSRATEISKIHP